MKFAFFTLGCKVNLFETQALSQLAQARGHEIVDKGADAVIVNTCTVTSVSDHKNIRAFHKLRRDNPNAVIAACGCFAQTDPERVRAHRRNRPYLRYQRQGAGDRPVRAGRQRTGRTGA